VSGQRRLVMLLGDQLDPGNAAIAAADPATDTVLMVESAREATHVWSHKQRIAVFFAAMRHRAARLEDEGWQVDYRRVGTHQQSLGEALADAVDRHGAAEVLITAPGEWRVRADLEAAAARASVGIRWFEDTHFFATCDQFRKWAEGRKSLVMEYFYREMRRRHDVLMDDGEPVTGRWNFDKENRGAFGKKGPGKLPAPRRFEPDSLTREAIADVETHFGDHPGNLDRFGWPVTPEDAQSALEDFVAHRLAHFGTYQDAMWTDEPWLYHSLLSVALNLKLLDPRDAVSAAERAWREGRVPLAAAEGFVRQVLGWREFVRGVYWLHMPDYARNNHYGHDRPLPGFFWSGDTDLNCLKHSLGDTLANGYAHHIQRLMVIGNFSLLAGLSPRAVCDWYLAIYADAVEWVELPNTLGMALHADGGIVGSKPYVATGAYIRRMSNYCAGCRYDPKAKTGEQACPFTTLYWHFLDRNRDRLAENGRMGLVLRNLERLDQDELAAIGDRARAFLDSLDG
jgi:deoxyribodipyrimidine photolyase-related protein